VKKRLSKKIIITLLILAAILVPAAIVYTKYPAVRSITERGYYRFLETYSRDALWQEQMDRIDQFPALNQTAGDEFRYAFTYLPVYDEMKKEYPLEEKAGDGDTMTRSLNLMEWFCSNTKYNGASFRNPFKAKNRYMNLMRYALKNTFSHSVNCADMAMGFSDCLLAVGICAMPVWLMNTNNCHVVVHVYLPEEERWVMLDPSFDAYLLDGAGKVLDLIEIRARTAKKEPLEIARYSLNGSQFFKENYLPFFVQSSLFEFGIWRGNAPELRESDCVWLEPEGFDVDTDTLTLISEEQFLAKPIPVPDLEAISP